MGVNNYVDQGFVKLDNLVVDLIAKHRHTTLHRYVWYLLYMMDGYSKLVQSTIPITSQKWIQMTKTKVVPFPKDFVGAIGFGYPRGDRVIPIDIVDTIVRIDESDGRYIPLELQFRNYYRGYNRIGLLANEEETFMGAGHNLVGYVTVDLQRRQFKFSVDTRINPGEHFHLEYISNQFDEMNDDTRIYYAAAHMLQAWADFQWEFYQHGPHDRRTAAMEDEFIEERREFKNKTSNLSANAILGALGRVASVHPKF